MLQVSKVSKEYPAPRGALQVLSEATFTLSPGEAAAITGPSGSGKSSLLTFCALEPRQPEGALAAGSFTLSAESTPTSERELLRLPGDCCCAVAVLRTFSVPYALVASSGPAEADYVRGLTTRRTHVAHRKGGPAIASITARRASGGESRASRLRAR